MSPTLLMAIASLVVWAIVVHLLLALGTVLLVRWWALRA
jgi:hypothetical protein